MFISGDNMIYGTSEQEVREIKSLELRIVPDLEEWTGADLMISPLSLPVTEVLLSKHLERGAILIQIKRGHDLVASIIDNRLNSSLAKMRACGAKQSQCLLLFVGNLFNADGKCVINGTEAKMYGDRPYWQVYGAMSKWWKRGGVVESLPRFDMLPDWARMTERHLKEMLNDKHVQVYPDDRFYLADANDPLQELELVTDWRRTLASIPGLGPKRIEALYKVMGSGELSQFSQMTLLQALVWLTTYEFAKQAGIGAGLVDNIRRWIGIDEGFELCVMPMPSFVNPRKED